MTEPLETLYACTASVDMFRLTKEDFIPPGASARGHVRDFSLRSLARRFTTRDMAYYATDWDRQP